MILCRNWWGYDIHPPPDARFSTASHFKWRNWFDVRLYSSLGLNTSLAHTFCAPYLALLCRWCLESFLLTLSLG